jgi:thiol-disulfide isomerase/thioredoxin
LLDQTALVVVEVAQAGHLRRLPEKGESQANNLRHMGMHSRLIILLIGLVAVCSYGFTAPAQSIKARDVPLPDVREIDLDGLKTLLRRDPKDTRPLLVNFWATWCDSCREEFPDLVKIDNDYRTKGLNFVAVSLDEVTEIKTEVPKFLQSMNATMPNVLLNIIDPEPAIHFVDAMWDGQLPATFLYDKEGKVVYKHFGRIKPEELRAALDKVMSGK